MLQLFVTHSENRSSVNVLKMNQEERSMNLMFKPSMGEGSDDLDPENEDISNKPYRNKTIKMFDQGFKIGLQKH